MRFMLNCKEIHRLTSEGLDRELTLMERTHLRAHGMICNACHNFTVQMQLIRQSMRALDQTHHPAKPRNTDDTWQ
jgi:hypothetical protein